MEKIKLGTCVKTLEKEILSQNELCQTICGEMEGKICTKGCMSFYSGLGGMTLFKNAVVENFIVDAVVVNDGKTLTTLLYPNSNNADELLLQSELFLSYGLSKSEAVIFKKVLEVNAESVYNSFINPSQAEPALMDEASVEEDIGPVDIVPLQNKIVLKSVEDVDIEEEERIMEPIVQVVPKPIVDVVAKPKRVAKKAVAEPGQELVTEFPKKKRATTKKAQVVEPIAQVENVLQEPIAQVENILQEPIVEKKKRVAKKALIPEEKAPTKTRKTKKDADKEPAL